MHRNEIDTWDYPWTASVWFHGGLTATPNVNLVSNIGFGEFATHTKSKDSHLSAMKTFKLKDCRRPKIVVHDVLADSYAFKNSISGRIPIWALLRLNVIKKLIKKLCE